MARPSQRILLLATASSVGLVFGHPALAQAPAATAGAEAVGEIVVTASRVARTGFTAPTPTTVLGQETIQARAAVNVADIINEVPAFRPTQTPQASSINGQFGANFVDLRGLGVNRTLVLIDGRRHVPSNTQGSVDLNLIPSSLMERTEVVTGGASAAWGSDAVAGVVNLILRERLQGVQGNVSYGQTDKDDGQAYNLSLAAGTAFAGGRARVIAGIEYDENKGLPIYDDARDWAQKRWGTLSLAANRAPGLPSRILSSNVHFSNQLTAAGVIPTGPLANTTFTPTGTPVPFRLGTLVAGNQMIGGENEDETLFTGVNIINPVKRLVGLARLTYDVTPNLTAFLELSYGSTEQDARGANRRNQANLTINIDNAFMSPILRQRMLTAGVASVPFGRVETEIGHYFVHNERDTRRGVFGLRGELGSGWSWDAYYQYGYNQGFESRNQVLVSNYNAAIDAVVGPTGAIICRPSTVVAQRADPGCVPYNVFGVGAPSAAAQAYVQGRAFTHTFTREQVAAVNVRGEPFSVLAGPVSVAAGAEWREESANVKSDPNSTASRFDSGNVQPIRGSFSVKEIYAEAVAPLAREVGFIQSVDLNGAVRRTDYSLSGAVTTWKGGVTFEDTSRQVRLRATRSRDIRAANIQELFGARQAAVNQIRDPLTNLSGLATVLTSGSTSLRPEEADTLTYGVVLSPNFIPGLRVSADYYDIDIKGVIASIGGQNVVDRCFAGATELCSLITRTPAGAIATVLNNQLNLNGLQTNGWDFEASYRAPIAKLGLPGELNIRGLATLVEHLTTVDAAGPVDRARQTVPRWAANVSLNYALNRFSTNLTARMVGARLSDTTLIGPDDPSYNPALPNSINVNRIPAVWYFNLSAQYTVMERDNRRLVLYGVVNNLTDKDPPAAGANNAISATVYDLLGRFFRVGLRFNY